MQIIFPLHKLFQVDGFLTLLIMGVGYMIVPRFRNTNLPSTKLAYLSLLFVLLSIVTSIFSIFENDLIVLVASLRFCGVAIFAAINLWMLRIQPRLLRMADYFISLSIITVLAIELLQLWKGYHSANKLSEVQLYLLFPILMIFGIEYKTLPSFLGFIRPAKKLSVVSIGLAAISVVIGLLSIMDGSLILAAIFNITFLACAISFSSSLYLFRGFDNSEIVPLMQGEKKTRYGYTKLYSKLAFIFLYAGITTAVAFCVVDKSYIWYDLTIHYTAIGFIGITIALYLPLMLQPITGRMVHFTKFNNIPILLVVTALILRTGSDVAISVHMTSNANYFFMISGWLIVSALLVFVIMVHRAMKETNS